MAIHLSNDVSVAKKVLIPAAVATAIGIAGLGGFQHIGERIRTQTETCQPERMRLLDRHNPEPSIPQRTIPDEHWDRLIAAGYVREVVGHSASGSAPALTGAGLRRLESGK